MNLNYIYSLATSVYFFVIIKIVQLCLNLVFKPPRSDHANKSLQSFEILADVHPRNDIINRKSFFLLQFKKIKDVSYLDRADVTLYTVTKDEFVFVRTKPEVDIFDIQQHSFLYAIQHTAAVEVLTASHETVFRYLRGKPERNGANIAYLHNPGRCGSTLIAAMIYKTKQYVILSEPTPVLNLALMFSKKDYPPSRKTTEYLELLKATLLLLCQDQNKMYFIKPWGISTLSLQSLIHLALPGVKEMFMYRAIQPNVLSYKKIIQTFTDFRIEGNQEVSFLPVNYRNIWGKIKCGNGDEVWSFVILCQIHAFMLETQDRDDIKSYSYESLLKDKEGFAKSLLNDIGIGEEYVTAAILALDRDSQSNSRVSWDKMVEVKPVSVAQEAIEWATKIAETEFGIEMKGNDGWISNMPHLWSSIPKLSNLDS